MGTIMRVHLFARDFGEHARRLAQAFQQALQVVHLSRKDGNELAHDNPDRTVRGAHARKALPFTFTLTLTH
jgi:hypothetical protein